MGKTRREFLKGADGKDVDVGKLLADLPEPARQQDDFIDSCVTRRKFCFNEETGFRSCTMFNLAIVAERLVGCGGRCVSRASEGRLCDGSRRDDADRLRDAACSLSEVSAVARPA